LTEEQELLSADADGIKVLGAKVKPGKLHLYIGNVDVTKNLLAPNIRVTVEPV
jgi:hypothetical protein